jgi:hypothetical protein
METSAAQFVERLDALRPPGAAGPDDYHGRRHGPDLRLARECQDMSPAEIARLLDSRSTRFGSVP